jgi:hypothetical protein
MTEQQRRVQPDSTTYTAHAVRWGADAETAEATPKATPFARLTPSS